MTRISTAVDVSSFSTDAKFRTWGLAISTSLAAAGLVKTADTGQVDWTTVTRPVTTNTVAGYEVWRFNDALQSTAPIFIKMSYGSSFATSGASPNVWFQVGTGSDGAGSITGLKTAATVQSPAGGSSNLAATATAMAMLFTHTAGFFLAYSESYNSSAGSGGFSPMFFAIERTRDQTTGAATAEGMYVWRAMFSSAALPKGMGQAFSFTLAAAQLEAPTACMPPGDSVTYGGYLFPVYCCIPRPLVCAGLVGYMDTEIANYSTFTAKPIGTTTTRTYIALNNCGPSSLYSADAVTGVTNESAVRTAFLWED